MAIPTNSDELIDWSFRKLGSPMLKINVTPEQAEDRLNEALEKYYQHHYDATEEVYYAHTVTQDDIDNMYITLPESTMVVKGMIDDLYSGSGGGADGNFMSYEFQAHMSDIVNNINTGIVSYYMRRDYLELMQGFFKNTVTPRYERHTNKVYLPIDWTTNFTADESCIFLQISKRLMEMNMLMYGMMIG